MTDAKVGPWLAAALNDWVVEDFCSADPQRLLPVATIPLHDPKFAVAELERCVNELGMRAAWVAPSPTMGRTINDPANDPVWKKASDLGIPMTTHHGSGGGRLQALGRDRNKTWLGAHAMGHTFEAMAAIVGLYTSGVFQRYPKLRWGFMEAGTGWLPYWLHQIHEHAERMEFLIPDVKLGRDVIDHFKGRYIVTAEADDLFVNNAMDAAGENAVVWASDFPHYDCSLPGLADEVRDRTDLSPRRMNKLAIDNAVEFFDLKLPNIRNAKK
ncbi:MAG: amidohydrolase [Betaproteobacteria bacterium]|nr:amidohydrolase [Betaproteobacteria bacterium]